MSAFESIEEICVKGRHSEAFKVEAGSGRLPEPLHVFENDLTVKVSSRDTGGAFAVMEGVTPPLSGPPLHVHHNQDEWWHVLEGDFRFEVDGVEIVAAAGAHVYAPRGSRHTFQNIGETPGRMVVTVVPGGLDLFFEEIRDTVPPGSRPDPAALAPIFERHGMELLGPPLGARAANA